MLQEQHAKFLFENVLLITNLRVIRTHSCANISFIYPYTNESTELRSSNRRFVELNYCFELMWFLSFLYTNVCHSRYD